MSTIDDCVAILMRGHPGCGKSTLARALGTLYRVPVVDKDDAKDALQELSNIVEDSIINRLSYDIMINITKRQLFNRMSVIVDSPLSKKSMYECLKHVAKDLGATIVVVKCTSSDRRVWNDRLIHRKSTCNGVYHKPSDLDQVLDLIQSYNGGDGWRDDDDAVHNISLDTTTTQSLDDQVRFIDDYLRQNNINIVH